jgi:2-dehydropantoate 2-reductase
MRFVVYGAGAVGGSVAALLSRAGFEVVIVARGAHLAAIQKEGLLFRTPQEDWRLDIPAVSGPAEVDWREGDVVLLGMKTQDTEVAIRGLDPDLPVVCLQNGVANERIALRHFANVYPVCVMFPSTHLEPGVVEANSWPVPGILDIGRYPSGVDNVAEEIAVALRAAGCHSQPRADIMRWKYRKLLMNLGNAVQAVCAPEGVREIARLVRDEGAEVLAAAGIDPVTEAEDDERRGDLLRVQGSRGGGSSWQSLKRGTGSIESDYLNGEIVLVGRLNGIDARYNDHARRMANYFASQQLPPGTMPASEWLSTLDL